ncbi:MAG: phosphoribosylformylglycinamidine cyclo-ligase, partial [Pseudomonadota bacterium]
MTDAYKRAGVDIDAGARLVTAIKAHAASTARAGARADLGGFGGVFDPKAAGLIDPLFVSGADGVGTKLKLAFAMDKHDTIGIDLVAMCANDVLAHAAAPLFFLDYFSTGKLDEETAAQVVAGIAAGCRDAGCALIGGETAEMPGLYGDGEYDLAGFCVGAVERSEIAPKPAAPGDQLIALKSSGPHANGFSLIRKLIDDATLSLFDMAPFDASQTLGKALLTPTRIYVKDVLPLFKKKETRAFAHITGGGLTENIPRVLQQGLEPRFSAPQLTGVFEWLQELGGLSNGEMQRTFNCGIGGVLVIAPDTVEQTLS